MRFALFPFKVLSLLTILWSAFFVYSFYHSNLFKNLNSDQLFLLKAITFCAFLFISVITKILQAKISYSEFKKVYLVNKSLKVSSMKEKINDEIEDKDKDERVFSIVKENDFNKSHKIKYLFLVSFGILTTIVFVAPFLLQTFLEKFNLLKNNSEKILNDVSKYSYTILFSVLIVMLLIVHIVQFSCRMQGKYWPHLDGSIGQNRIGMCTFASIAKLPEYLMSIILNNNFLNKYEEQQNRELDFLDYVFYSLSRSLLLSDSQFFSNGIYQMEDFGIVRNENVNNKSLLQDVMNGNNKNIPNSCLRAFFCSNYLQRKLSQCSTE